MTIVPGYPVTFVTRIRWWGLLNLQPLQIFWLLCRAVATQCIYCHATRKSGRYELNMQVIKLLIIDEHTAVRRALRIRLSSSPGIQVVGTAADLATGLAQLEHSDTVIDVVLLGLSGSSERDLRQTIHEVKALAAKNTAVIVLTSYADDIEREVVSQAGATRYLLKDINSDQLIDEISHVLA